MRLPVQLLTTKGTKYSNWLGDELHTAKQYDLADLFRHMCSQEALRVENNIELMLEDDDLSKQYPLTEEDKTGWQIYNELSDRLRALNYVANGRA